MAPTNEQDFWNFFFAVFFGLVVLGTTYVFFQKYGEFSIEINFLEFFLISLATFRLVRLFTYDKIMSFFRNIFFGYGKGPLKTIYELLICPWCTGLWMALMTAIIYFLIPMGEFFILILAVAGLGSLIQSLANIMGKIGNNYK